MADELNLTDIIQRGNIARELKEAQMMRMKAKHRAYETVFRWIGQKLVDKGGPGGPGPDSDKWMFDCLSQTVDQILKAYIDHLKLKLGVDPEPAKEETQHPDTVIDVAELMRLIEDRQMISATKLLRDSTHLRIQDARVIINLLYASAETATYRALKTEGRL